ncbi:MAG: L-lactate permease [Nitrosospira sp.]|nr:L-lactate permease [Nitrosospira sp.]
MSLALSIAPVLLLFGLILVTPLGAITAASVSFVFALALALVHSGMVQAVLVGQLAPQIGVLVVTVASVIIPGLIFVRCTRENGATDNLRSWIASWQLNSSTKVAVIVVGVAPAIESMTGFGVSMVVTVPVLLGMLERPRALLVGLLGMNIMPWGTLGLATIVGAAIAGTTPWALGYHTAIASLLVFPLAAALAVVAAGYRRPDSVLLATSVGGFFSACLIGANYALGPAVAGVLSGLIVVFAILLIAKLTGQSITLPSRKITPYAALLLFVLLGRAVWVLFPCLHDVGIQAGRFYWRLFESPGIPLLLAALTAGLKKNDIWPSIRKSIKPLLSVTMLLALSQTMVLSGQMHTIAQALKSLSGFGGALIFAPFSALSGYISGSNVAANALLMPTANLLDGSSGLSYASVQNSAAGHAVLASIPIIVFLLSVADGGTKEEESLLMRFGAIVAGVNALLIGCVVTFLF